MGVGSAGPADFTNGLPGFISLLQLETFGATLGDVSVTARPGRDGVTLDIALRPASIVPARIFDLYGAQASEVVLADGARLLRFVLDRATFGQVGFADPISEFLADGSGATAAVPNGDTRHVRGQEAAPNFWIGGSDRQNEYRDAVEFWAVSPSAAGRSDFLLGGAIRDAIFGGNGADWVEGAAGDDALYGQPGADIIIGGPGNDYMFGDDSTGRSVPGFGYIEDLFVAPRGADLFVFRDGFGDDRIRDFDLGLDKIVFGTATMRSFDEIRSKIEWISATNPSLSSFTPFGDAPDDRTLNLDASRIEVAEQTPAGIRYSTIRVDGITPDEWTAANFATRPAPVISVGNVSVGEGTTPPAVDGFLRASGNQIVDAGGNPFRIAGVNWFGMETVHFAPDGMHARNWRDMMDQMAELGFNTIRLPFSAEALQAGTLPTDIDYGLNPDLVGLTALEVMDRIIDYAGRIGLRIILDHHRSEAGDGPNGNGLWYTATHTAAQWIDTWVMLAQRYAGNPVVIGADLHNEPHAPAGWGTGDLATDWRLAAERAGNAIGAVNPDWLIFVEGIDRHAGQDYWWGGNLGAAAEHPVRLNLPDKLVYSAHDYPNSIFAQTWFSDPDFPNNLPAEFQRAWGYLFDSGISPIYLGEIGSRLIDPKDIAWMDKIVAYMGGDIDADGTRDIPAGQFGPGWTWWAWNPTSGDTGGILKDDWITVEAEKLQRLAPVMSPPGGPLTGETIVEFRIALSSPATETVIVDYRTVQNGSAVAGGDFAAASGSITFLPGEQEKFVRTTVTRDSLREGNETFSLVLSNARNGVLGQATGIATIVDDDADRVGPHEARGGAGADTLNGLDKPNAMYGGGGNDEVVGQRFDDLLAGDAGSDTLRGGHGNDRLYGDDQDDLLEGGAGADTLYGGTGADTADYARSAQAVAVSLATFLGTGAGGDAAGDRLVGIEHLAGSVLADTLIGSGFANRLSGGVGNDTLVGGAGADTLDGGAGHDWASYAPSAAAIAVNLGIASAQGGVGDAAGDVLIGIEAVIGSDFADSLTGNGGDNTLLGGDGNDTLSGGLGADSLAGGKGDDRYEVTAGDILGEALNAGIDTVLAEMNWTLGGHIENLILLGSAVSGTGNSLANVITGNAEANTLNGGGRADTMVGGEGNDTYLADATDTLVEQDGGGLDTVVISASFTLPQHVEVLRFNGSANARGDGNDSDNFILGNIGNNRLIGYGGNDTLNGGAGNDTLSGGDGADSLVGGTGTDRLDGGADNDIYVLGDLDVVIEAANAGIDTVLATISLTLMANVENLSLLDSANLTGTGNTLANVILGNAGSNLLLGLGGADSLVGANGNDTLVGGAEADTLSGGGGLDRFVYANALEGNDVITDYRVADDTLEVSALGFGGGLSLGMDVVAAGRYVANTSGLATSAAGVGQFVFESDVRVLWWDADGAGGSDALRIATLTNVAGFVGTEIVVVA
jgi:Ca2+-binding RTX toxin-like protein/aryl-phospho-beta-D-glucosidase BglC (GH1 family)